jgi:hypothetical protein
MAKVLFMAHPELLFYTMKFKNAEGDCEWLPSPVSSVNEGKNLYF